MTWRGVPFEFGDVGRTYFRGPHQFRFREIRSAEHPLPGESEQENQVANSNALFISGQGIVHKRYLPVRMTVTSDFYCYYYVSEKEYGMNV
jgi:hypothetical protein